MTRAAPRVARLEQHPIARCPHCQGREGRGGRLLVGEGDAEPTACPVCGQPPRLVRRIVGVRLADI